jgi:putative addiction module component (TIGR02574 family)
MSLQKSQIFDEARKLPPIERAELIESLLESFSDKRQKEIDERWAKEGGSRIDAYNAGTLDDMPIDDVYKEIKDANNK